MERIPLESLFANPGMGNCLYKLKRTELRALEDAILLMTDAVYRKNGAKIRKLTTGSMYGTLNNTPRVGVEAREGKKEWDKDKKKRSRKIPKKQKRLRS
jgi:hypothetical protein